MTIYMRRHIGMMLQHDNAKSHVARLTAGFLCQSNARARKLASAIGRSNIGSFNLTVHQNVGT